MRHRRQTKRFNRNPKERKAMLENLVSSLLSHQQITTTLQKAKQTQRLADHVITLGKNDTLASRRQVFSYLQDHVLTSRIFKEVAPRFKTRKGGYTRILHLQRRKGDGAELALIELTEKEIRIKEPKVKSKKDAKDHDHKHDHKHEADTETKHEAPKSKTDKDTRKAPETKKGDQKTGFFRNVSKFFRNKGGG